MCMILDSGIICEMRCLIETRVLCIPKLGVKQVCLISASLA